MSLPESLCWPNLEVAFFATFSTGLLQCSAAVLGATMGGYPVQVQDTVLAAVVFTLIGFVYARESHKIILFYRHHAKKCWVPAEPPQSKDEVDDPALALLTNVSRGAFAPRAREVGGWEPPEDDGLEPARTERLLRRCFSWSAPDIRHQRSGDAMAEMYTWLMDASGTMTRAS